MDGLEQKVTQEIRILILPCLINGKVKGFELFIVNEVEDFSGLLKKLVDHLLLLGVFFVFLEDLDEVFHVLGELGDGGGLD